MECPKIHSHTTKQRLKYYLLEIFTSLKDRALSTYFIYVEIFCIYVIF